MPKKSASIGVKWWFMDNSSVKKIKKEYIIAAVLFIAVIAVAFVSFGKNDATGGLSETEIYVGTARLKKFIRKTKNQFRKTEKRL